MAVTGSYVTQASSTSNATTYTFSSTSTGTAAADRINVVAAGVYASSSNTPHSSVTVNGVAGTYRIGRTNFSNGIIEIWDAANPTGTSGDIVVTAGEAQQNCNIGVWELTGADATPTDSDTTTATNTNETELTTVTMPTDGFGIFAWISSTNGAVTSWSGATQRYDVNVESREHSGADSSTPGTPTVHVTEGIGGTTGKVLIGLSYGPSGSPAARPSFQTLLGVA